LNSKSGPSSVAPPSKRAAERTTTGNFRDRERKEKLPTLPLSPWERAGVRDGVSNKQPTNKGPLKIYYSGAQNHPDVSFEAPADEPPTKVLEIYRTLDPKQGFLGLVLSDRFTIQMIPKKNGIRIELLDSTRPGIDEAMADASFGLELIDAIAQGEDAFALAKARLPEWQRIDFRS
jgi:hypothetical protein